MSLHRILAAVGVALCVSAMPLHAHLMPVQSGTLNVRGTAVFGAISIPVSALTGFDDDGNARLSVIELQRHLDALKAQVSSRLHLANDTERGSGRRSDRKSDSGVREFLQLSVEINEADTAAADGGLHLLVLVKQQFASVPTNLTIRTDLFGTRGAESQLAIKAMHDGTAEMVVLRARHSEHRFFRSPVSVAQQYTELGIEHILGGFDHVLFVLTIVMVAAGWRYWLAVLTSFTVAHSITLALGMLNIVRVPSAIVEPLILGSILLMFALNLAQRRANSTSHATSNPRLGARSHTRSRIAIVFACGLLHGLGFASSIADVGLNGAHKVASLAGFNIGIELGQALIVAAALLVMSAARAVGASRPSAFHAGTRTDIRDDALPA